MPVQTVPALDAKEVASCRWVPLSAFHNAQIDHVSYPMRLSPARAGSNSLTIGTMNFPGIILPEGEEFYPAAPSPDEANATSSPSPAYTYHLWGITLDIIEDLSVHLNLCERGTISHLPRSWNPLVKFYVWHHHYVPHALKGLPFWSGIVALSATAGYFAWTWLKKR